MDWLPKITVGIRSPASSAVYRSALKGDINACYGFFIGTRDEWTRVIFDFALPVCSLSDIDNLEAAPGILPKHLAAATELARHADSVVNGIFLAWDSISLANRNQFLGLFIDLAKALEIPYVANIPIDGHETFWGASIFFASRFPHDALRYKRLAPRRSDQPHHNPRKIARLWKMALSKPM